MGSLRRLFVVAPLVPWLALTAVFAHEHVHESESGHHAAFAHSHVAPHGVDGHETSHRGHDDADVSDVDEPVVWIDEVGLVQATRSFAPLLDIPSTHIEIVAPRLVRVAVIPDQATLPHGPPLVSPSLRASFFLPSDLT